MDTCISCQSPFEITQDDLKFYDRISPVINGKKYQISPPTHCPDCRQQRRLSFRNERTLYRSKCSLTGKPIISVYPPDTPFTVYDRNEWEKQEKWDPLNYGQNFDFGKPFFEQFKDLQKKVPRKANYICMNTENSEYCNYIWNVKNSYLCVNMGYSEDCLYSQECYYSKNLLECLDVKKSELCAYLYHCTNCYNSFFLENCSDCSDSFFSIDCKNCEHLILCSNLRHKKYCILNKEYTKEEYYNELHKIPLGKGTVFQKFQKKFNQVKRNAIHNENCNIQVENCLGDYLSECQNCFHCFNAYKTKDCKYVFNADSDAIDSYDFNGCAEMELCYEGVCVSGYKNLFSTVTVRGNNNMYCHVCENCEHCFGCIGLKRKKYCILNKQYTKEEYFNMLPQIIEYMTKTKEWGEFFPIKISPHAYNETVAQNNFPLTKEEAIGQGFKWRDCQPERKIVHEPE